MVVQYGGPNCACGGTRPFRAVARVRRQTGWPRSCWAEGSGGAELVSAARTRGRGRGRGTRRDRPRPRRRDRKPRSTSSIPSSSSSAAASARPASCCSSPAQEVVASEALASGPRHRAHRAGRARADGRPRRAPGSSPSRLSSSAARGLRDADRQPRGRHPARAARAGRGGARPLRGHAAHAERSSSATESVRGLLSYHEHNEAARTAEVLPRLQAGERIALVERRGPAWGQRPRCAADRGCARGRRAGDRAAGRLGGRDGARGERARRRAVPVRRLPASRRERAARHSGRSSSAWPHAGRGVRVAAAAAREPGFACRGPCRSGRSRSAGS